MMKALLIQTVSRLKNTPPELFRVIHRRKGPPDRDDKQAVADSTPGMEGKEIIALQSEKEASINWEHRVCDPRDLPLAKSCTRLYNLENFAD